MNMLEKIQSRLEHLSKSERKVAEVILATPAQAIHSSIAALALEAGVSEPRLTVSAAAWKRAVSRISNCILHKAWRTVRSMLTATSMKTTALSPIRERYLSQPWPV